VMAPWMDWEIDIEFDAATGLYVVEHRPTATQMIIATPAGLAALMSDPDWADALGVYLLWFPPSLRWLPQVYAGTTTHRPLVARVWGHLTGMPGWARMLLVRRNAPGGFTPGESRLLEALVIEGLHRVLGITVRNRQRPAAPPVSPAHDAWLGEVADLVLGVCDMAGMFPAHLPAVQPARGEAKAKVSVADLIASGDLCPGELLFPAWKTDGIEPAILNADGSHTWRGTTYTRISQAARLARGGKKTSGWQYWCVRRAESLIPLGAIRANYHDRQPAV